MNKTIDINPALFSVGLSKTKKNKGKNIKRDKIPIISPNILKNKLLKRIKEHKKRETDNLESKKSILEKKIEESNDGIMKPNLLDLSYSDEFNDSINYLQTLSKQKKIDDEKCKNEIMNQNKRDELERKTLKNYHSIGITNNPNVNIDLPDELKETLINVNTEQLKFENKHEMPVNQNIKLHDVPYGILKGGNKPTYRSWNKTQKTLKPYNSVSISTSLDNNQIKSSIPNEREKRLSILKEKIKQKQSSANKSITETNKPIAVTSKFTNATDDDIWMNTNFIQKPELTNLGLQSVQEPEQIFITVPTKKIIKKTIHRKYTVGKSKIKRVVSVLLKDRGTRKKIIAAYKDLKKKNMVDIKKYMRNHNLIKIGSNAPNDVIRKIFESAIMAGEITNINQSTLLHNFMKDDSEL